MSDVTKRARLLVDVVRGKAPACLALNDATWREQATATLEDAADEIDKLRAELEGDNGLRASNATGWALAGARAKALGDVADALPDGDWQPGAMPHADAVRNIVRERDAYTRTFGPLVVGAKARIDGMREALAVASAAMCEHREEYMRQDERFAHYDRGCSDSAFVAVKAIDRAIEAASACQNGGAETMNDYEKESRALLAFVAEHPSSTNCAGALQLIAELLAIIDKLRIEREEWADAIRSVAYGAIPSAAAGKAAIEELRNKWEAVTADRDKLRAELAELEKREARRRAAQAAELTRWSTVNVAFHDWYKTAGGSFSRLAAFEAGWNAAYPAIAALDSYVRAFGPLPGNCKTCYNRGGDPVFGHHCVGCGRPWQRERKTENQ